MKCVSNAVAILIVACAPAWAQTGAVGTWRVEGVGVPFPWEATFNVNGPRLTGAVSSCASPRVEISDGHIDGNTITFKCKRADGVATISFTGTISGDEITLSWELTGAAAGSRNGLFGPSAPRRFTAKRVPPPLAPATPAAPPDGRAPLKLLLFYDMEGASGVVDGQTMDPSDPTAFARGRASLIGDVNAVIAGLFDGGATTVDIKNAHGYGGDSLVPRERLDGRANIVSGKRLHPYDPEVGLAEFGYHGVVTVAMHDGPRSGGFSPHTLGIGTSPVINGATVTETGLVGYAYGTADIPVIFSSGDDRLQATLAAAMPWVEYAVVKRVTAPMEVASLPPEQVRRALRSAAERAVRGLAEPGRMRVMRLTAPFRAGLVPSYPHSLPWLGTLPGLERHGDTVTFVASNYHAAYQGFFVLQRISGAFGAQQYLEFLQGRPELRGALKEASDSVLARWKAFEQGKWKPR